MQKDIRLLIHLVVKLSQQELSIWAEPECYGKVACGWRVPGEVPLRPLVAIVMKLGHQDKKGFVLHTVQYKLVLSAV